MIRVVAIGSLLSLLVLVLYLPSARPPERFLAQLRIEHQATVSFWGAEPALRILDRALSQQDAIGKAVPIPSMVSAPSTGGVDNAVTQEMVSINQRLFNNSYFRSIDALLLLASFRVSALLEWLPWLLTFVGAAIIDGGIVRRVKAKEFRQHDPEMFAIHACGAIVMACTAVVCCVIPMTLHPLTMPLIPITISVFASRAMASFHRRA